MHNFFCSPLDIFRKLPDQGVVVCDQKLSDYFPNFIKSLKSSFSVFFLDVHEQKKTLTTALEVIEFLTANGVHKKTPLIAIGGGIIGDVCGFVASIYLRSIPLHLVPTTLVAAIDAHIGGKNGVNHNGAKNILGTITTPTALYLCPEFFTSLSSHELINGWAEMLKLSLISKKLDFNELSYDTPLLLQKDLPTLKKYVQSCITIKEEIVKNDLSDKNTRRLLNFGHTFGHALESYLNNTISHGEAVLWGLLQECYLSAIHEVLPFSMISNLVNVYHELKIPCASYDIDSTRFINLMKLDKKNEGSLASIMIQNIGTPYTVEDRLLHPITPEQVKQCIQWQTHGY